jgi:hypothetical protein
VAHDNPATEASPASCSRRNNDCIDHALSLAAQFCLWCRINGQEVQWFRKIVALFTSSNGEQSEIEK